MGTEVNRATRKRRRPDRAVGFLAIFLGLVFFSGALSQQSVQVGYGVLSGDTQELPLAVALYSARDVEGVLLWEAAVGGVPPLRRGRIYVEQGALIRSALAIVNPTDQPITLSFTLRDSQGLEIGQEDQAYQAGQHAAFFVDEIFPDLGNFLGSVTVEVQEEIGRFAAVTLRQSTNHRSEPIFATLPVADLEGASTEDAQGATPLEVVFPQLGAGANLSSQIVLINPLNRPISGEMEFLAADGSPLVLSLDGVNGDRFAFELPPDGVFRSSVTSPDGIRTGFTRILPEAESPIPVGSVIFQFRSGGRVISEAGVPATFATQRLRLFVDNLETRTGVAVAPLDDPEEPIQLTLRDLNGDLVAESDYQIAQAGHARFVDELFPGLPVGFSGILEINSPRRIAAVALKLTMNGRGDPILTTLPVADLMRPLQSDLLVLPQIAFGQGFSTDIILVSGGIGMAQPVGSRFSIRWDLPFRFPWKVTW